jgi:hypothetical protein
LNPDGNTANFDVQAFKDPEQLLRILVPVLQSIDETRLGNSINVRDNLLSLEMCTFLGFWPLAAIIRRQRVHYTESRDRALDCIQTPYHQS